MEFIMITSSQYVAPPMELSSSCLIFAASKETQEQKHQVHRQNSKRKRSRSDAGPVGSDMVLRISGRLLKRLCFSEFQNRRHIAAESLLTDLENFHCVIVTYSKTAPCSEFKLIPSLNLNEYLFDVRKELLSRELLIVFTVWDNLEHLAISEQQHQLFLHHQEQRSSSATAFIPMINTTNSDTASAYAAVREGFANTTSLNSPFRSSSCLSLSLDEPERDRLRERFTNSSSHITPASDTHLHRIEPFINAVPAVTTPQDIKDLNELLDDGIIHIRKCWMNYLCSCCMHIPPLTLTMPCCGAVLCPPCLPSPPTVEGVSHEDRLCPVCHEEPSELPRSHPQHDERLSHLMKELKVLYLPQLKALRQSRESPGYTTRGLLPPNTSPILGAL